MAQRSVEAAPPPGRSQRAPKGRVAVSRPGLRQGHGNYAAIDLGTNNCRLLIARPSPDGFVVVDSFSRIVRLGEGLAGSGVLSTAAMDRALEALTICAEKIRKRHVGIVRSVATEACRRATNGRAFVDRVHAETGIALEIISTEQEARLAMAGCHALLEPGEGPALIFDIGGGSTELIVLDGHDAQGLPRIADWYSVPWGVVSLTESEPLHYEDVVTRTAGYATLRSRVAEALAPFAKRLGLPSEDARLLGTSGTVTTLGSVHLDLPRYDRRLVDGLIVPTRAMRHISTRLAALSVPERGKIASIGNERADLVVAGCAILEAIFDIWPAERLAVADRGIREGILRSLMARDGHSW
jgi:exopolyphosphatase / guanosine-5'-triphosphate,3'-diphosphate pyrophosphatase